MTPTEAASIADAMNQKFEDVGFDARAEWTGDAIAVAIPGDTPINEAEGIVAIINYIVKTLPGERPRVITVDAVAADEARFVTPADLADVVAMPEGAEPDDETTGKVLDLFEALCEAKRR